MRTNRSLLYMIDNYSIAEEGLYFMGPIFLLESKKFWEIINFFKLKCNTKTDTLIFLC